MNNFIKISDAAVILQGRNIDSKKLNAERRGLPYVVGASCIKDIVRNIARITKRKPFLSSVT